ncbi:uncharacterized protein F5147DRAFT_781150 [Suillus discolor]|uniref:Uncharacterized protein n=1 Tax=Suillus discolor TaxID=1912936 RepID=A0A9P7ETC2_9AGAM|nr:uncharacterized protein F5147DRAFT_781150 [Suillus discolor]KAG2088019.1 hypothetical protein F5147DRAFT_781150 [Suillus discolor]
MSHWHRLAKLHMHSDLTLKILDQTTTDLGEQFSLLKEMVCASYQTQELDREVDARSRWQAKEAAKWAENSKGKSKEKEKAEWRAVACWDYVASIRFFGTTDSYSTEPGELEHRTPKGRYRHTDKRAFVHQLTQIERREARLHRIKQKQPQRGPRIEAHKMASDPQLHHHIGQGKKMYDDLGQYLHDHAGDPAMKEFLPRLKDHIFNHLNPEIAESLAETLAHSEQHNSIFFKRNRLYHHNLARFNYTTYDVRRAQDVSKPMNSALQHYATEKSQ